MCHIPVGPLNSTPTSQFNSFLSGSHKCPARMPSLPASLCQRECSSSMEHTLMPDSPCSGSATARALVAAHKPPIPDLQWCRRTIQPNSRLQSWQWFTSVSPSHFSSALSFCWNSRASDFCQRASLSLGQNHIKERIHENKRITPAAFQKTDTKFFKS